MNNLSPQVHSITGTFRFAARAFCIGTGCLLLTYSVFFSGDLSGSNLHTAGLGPAGGQKRPLPKKEVWFDTLQPRTTQTEIAATSVNPDYVSSRRTFGDRSNAVLVKHQQPNSPVRSRRSFSRLRVNRSVVPSTLVIYAENGVIKTKLELAKWSSAKKPSAHKRLPQSRPDERPQSFSG